MNEQLSDYFKNFNERLTDDLGSKFDYATILNYSKKKKNLLSLNDDSLDLSFVKELDGVVEKIKDIVNNVNPSIDPESGYSSYEDRYIVFLIDQISTLLAITSSNIASSVKKLNGYYINHHIPFNEVTRLKGLKLLNSGENPHFKEERKFVQLRETIGRLMETNYYLKLKNSGDFSEENINLSDTFANDHLYNACYNYHEKLKELRRNNNASSTPTRNIDYQNYAFLKLILAFDERGFALSGQSPEFDNKDYLLRVKNLKLARSNITVLINADSDDHIDLLFQDNNAYQGKNKKLSKVSLDLFPSLNGELVSKEEASAYFKKKIKYRFNNGYDNAFILTSIADTQDDNVIIVSPYGNPLDATLSNMIESCLIYLLGDNFTYSHFCPVCGGHVERKEQDNYHCSTCGSVYELLKDKDKKETIWVKRLNNLEGK